MAENYLNAKPDPIWGEAHVEGVEIWDVTTGKLHTAIGAITAEVSLNGAAFTSTGVSATQAVAGSGIIDVGIDATRMSPGSTPGLGKVTLRVTVAGANATDAVRHLYPAPYYRPATDFDNYAVLIQNGTSDGQLDSVNGAVPLSPDGMRQLAPTDILTISDAQDLFMLAARYYAKKVSINRDAAKEVMYGDDGSTVRFTAAVDFDGTTESKGEFEP